MSVQNSIIAFTVCGLLVTMQYRENETQNERESERVQDEQGVIRGGGLSRLSGVSVPPFEQNRIIACTVCGLLVTMPS